MKVTIKIKDKTDENESIKHLEAFYLDPSLFFNFSFQDIRMPPSSIWAPDILMYNSASESFDSTYQTNVVVTSAGLCTYIPPGIFKSSCPIDITWFPFDDQVCEYYFQSKNVQKI